MRSHAFFVLVASLLAMSGAALAQSSPQTDAKQQQGGMSTGMAHAAVKDALSRPITAGGFVEGAPVTLTDVTEKARVANERWGFGVAVADYDNDGWRDLYLSNFGKNRLCHNNHDGTFTDVAEKAGVTIGGWSTGATWGDYDRDGLLDLFVPGYVKFAVDNPPIAGKGGLAPGYCQSRGVTLMS